MFQKNLKALRLKKGLSQKQVADYLTISAQSISKWEKGDALPSIEFLPKLAECLDCDVNAFFTNEEVKIIKYSLLDSLLRVMKKSIDDGMKNGEELTAFINANHDATEYAMMLCDKIKTYNVIQWRILQGILCCSEIEAKECLERLEGLEMVKKLEVNDFYFVDKDAMEGFKILLNTQKKLAEIISKKQGVNL